jgi:uncharacterized protein DUF5666
VVRNANCRKILLIVALGVASGMVTGPDAQAAAQGTQTPSTQAAAAARPVGTIKSVSGNTITLTTDAGSDVAVVVQDGTKLIRIAPGQKDLKDAVTIQLQELLPGDRILVRGKLADDGKSVLAVSVIAMKKADIAEKQAHEREEWQKHGTGGLVNSIDPATKTIVVSLPTVGEKKNVTIRVSKDTILRRYAPDSVKFDDAKPAPLDQIKAGDQLRARGTRSPDGNELTADEIVSGTFRNIAGTISSIDAAANSITLQDLATKKTITVKVTGDSQVRKLPLPMAQRIAARLKGTPADAPPSAGAAGAAAAANSNPPQAQRPAGPAAGGAGAGGAGGMGRNGGGGGDLQQAISRMPAVTLADFQKGDAVMIVATESGSNGMPSVITLLGGVEPILQASPNSGASSILSPWSLGAAPGGEAGNP